MNRNKKLGLNVIFMTLGNMASKMLSFLLIPLYTSVLSTTEYGVADIMTTTITLLAPIFTIKINEAVMRFCLDKESDKKKILSVGITTVGVGFVVLVLCSPIVFLFENIRLYYGLFLLYYLSSTLYTLLSQYTKGIEKVKAYAIGGVINTIIVITSNILFLLVFKIGITGYILSFVLGNLITCLYLVAITDVPKSYSIRKFDKKYFIEMIKYSAPMIPNSISWWITNSSDKYMVAYILGAAANGIYSIAYKIPSLLSTVNGIFMSAWHISAVEEFGSDESKIFFKNIYEMLSSLDALLVTGLIFLAKPLASFLYAKDFFCAWKFAIVLTLGFMFSSLSSFLGSIYTSSKKTSALFFTSLLGAVVNIGLNIILIPQMNALGAAIATTFSYIVVWIVRIIDTKRIFDFKKCLGKNIICMCLLIIQIIANYLEKKNSWIISGIIVLIIVGLNVEFVKVLFKKGNFKGKHKI